MEELFSNQQYLMEKVDEMERQPQKIKYFMDDLETKFSARLTQVNDTMESKQKEVMGYINSLHSELGNFLKKKKREKNDFVLELTGCIKKVDEMGKKVESIEKGVMTIATISAC